MSDALRSNRTDEESETRGGVISSDPLVVTPGDNSSDWSEAKALEHGRFMALDRFPVSDHAWQLTRDIAQRITDCEIKDRKRKNLRRGDRQRKFLVCVGRVVGDLLIAAKDGRWSSRGVSPQSFTGEVVGSRDFRAVFDGLQGIGFVEVKRGFYQRFGPDDEWANQGRLTRLRARPELLALAVAHGVDPISASTHYETELPAKPLVLKASSKTRNGLKVQGRPMRYEETDLTRLLRSEVEHINEFLAGRSIVGGEHRGYRRIFNGGDRSDFEWNKGGRLYSVGDDSYQMLKGPQRLQMRIDGQPVVEIDIRASHLTILAAKLGTPLDPTQDPYEVEAIPREIVKKWIVVSIGNGRFPKRWSAPVGEELVAAGHDLKAEFSIKRVQGAILERHPFLVELPDAGIDCFDLMFWESEAILRTMQTLQREHDVPCLSVHDSIIVPISASDVAKETLEAFYLRATGARCKLRVCHLQDIE